MANWFMISHYDVRRPVGFFFPFRHAFFVYFFKKWITSEFLFSRRMKTLTDLFFVVLVGILLGLLQHHCH